MMTFRIPTLLLAVTLSLTSCNKKHSGGDDEPDSAAPPVVAVKVTQILEGNLETFVAATGKTDVLRRQRVVSPVAGTILSLKALEGSTVREGDAIAVIRPREAQSAVAGAEVLLQSAHTAAEREDARRAIELAKATQNVATVRAAFSGVIASRSVTEGELVNENAELVTLVDLATITFVADIPLADAPRIRRGAVASVEFQSLPGVQFPASVNALYPQSDFQSQTEKVRLAFANSPRPLRPALMPDMMGTCRIITGVHRRVLLVPRSAVLRDDEKNIASLAVVQPDSVARIIPVTVGASNDSTVEVSGSGLAPGQRVVTEGNYALPDSVRVTW